MKEKMRQAIVDALIESYGMTTKEAEGRVFDQEEVDELYYLEQEELGEDAISIEVYGLSQAGHVFDLTVFYSSAQYFFVLVQFEEQTNVAAVKEALAKYEASSVSQYLYVENEIENVRDGLLLAFDIVGDLKEELVRLFELVGSHACTQLLDAVLVKEA